MTGAGRGLFLISRIRDHFYANRATAGKGIMEWMVGWDVVGDGPMGHAKLNYGHKGTDENGGRWSVLPL